MNKILGFAEDYEKTIINCKHELVLLQNNTNLKAIKLNTGEVVEDIIINKIVWRVPHIKVSDRERINLLKYLEKDRAIPLAFRSWDLYEYPLLPKTRKHTWSIKTSSQIEKPQFVVIGMPTNRKHNAKLSMAEFDHCDVRDTTAYCLILNNCIFEYKPLSNIVKKIS
ncbi:unnamed protein product [Parnassius mnemosyne]|uniref:Double jelly roll-like domain-containing protein n=1 Tax=Parnassius mnemosyne TaxID=213953 RepID=A0AAV1L6E2_9NEOP